MKTRYRISVILFIGIIILRIFFMEYFTIIKSYVSKELSLYNLSFLYASTPYSGIESVSESSNINVKDYKLEDNKYYVETLNNEIRLPFEGIITKKNTNYIKFEVEYDVIFHIYDLKPNVILYESVLNNEILGYSSSYIIWSNNIKNLSLLKYNISYEEV